MQFVLMNDSFCICLYMKFPKKVSFKVKIVFAITFVQLLSWNFYAGRTVFENHSTMSHSFKFFELLQSLKIT